LALDVYLAITSLCLIFFFLAYFLLQKKVLPLIAKKKNTYGPISNIDKIEGPPHADAEVKS
jgi:hypothetical protein